MLTEKQASVLRAVKAQLADGAGPPTLESLRAATGVGTKSGVSRVLDQLEARGCLQVVRPPQHRGNLNKAPRTIVGTSDPRSVPMVSWRGHLWRYIPMPQPEEAAA